MVVRTLRDIQFAHETGRPASCSALRQRRRSATTLDKLDILFGLGVRADRDRLLRLQRPRSRTERAGRLRADRLRAARREADNERPRPGDRRVARLRPHGDRDGGGIARAGVHDPRRCRALWGHPAAQGRRRAARVADSGGVIGISAAPHTTISARHRTHTIASVMDHFHYCADLVGLDHVGFGPDNLYGDPRRPAPHTSRACSGTRCRPVRNTLSWSTWTGLRTPARLSTTSRRGLSATGSATKRS